VLVSESIRHLERHVVGGYWNNWSGEVLFTTLFPPNTKVNDRPYRCRTSLPLQNLPCDLAGNGTPNGNAVDNLNLSARSYHTGGVNAALGDGSMRFVTNSINVLAWNAMGSRAGGGVVTE
jgi:hypothetical protein